MNPSQTYYVDRFAETAEAFFGAQVARQERAASRMPSIYGGNASIAALRCFRAYHKDARVEMAAGRWMTKKQLRVYGIAERIATGGSESTIQSIAREAGVCPSTVSRFFLKLQAWGIFAIDVRRGKYGGVRIYRVVGDRFADYARRAKAKLRELAKRAFNVASTLREKGERDQELPDTDSLLMDATLKRRTFAEQVMYERAYLALSDPDGEYEAIRPLSREEAIKMLDWKERPAAEVWAEQEQRLLDKAMEERDVVLVHRINVDRVMRELAAAGKWDKWQALADFLYPEHTHPPVAHLNLAHDHD